MPTIDEFFGTSNQVCGGFWPFGTDMALPAEGVPGRAKPDDGCRRVLRPDQLVQGRHHQTALYVPARPAGHRQEHVRAPRGAGTERPGHERDHPRRSEADYASLVNMLGGQVIRLGAGIGVVNPLDPGDLHYALQRLEGKARKDLTDYYNDTRAALMEVLLTIMRTGRENDTDAGAGA